MAVISSHRNNIGFTSVINRDPSSLIKTNVAYEKGEMVFNNKTHSYVTDPNTTHIVTQYFENGTVKEQIFYKNGTVSKVREYVMQHPKENIVSSIINSDIWMKGADMLNQMGLHVAPKTLATGTIVACTLGLAYVGLKLYQKHSK